MNCNAYYNGSFTAADKILIPLSDRAIFFGDGIYDAAIGRNGKIFMLKEHLARFFLNAERLGIPLTMSKSELGSLLLELVSRSGGTCDCFVYFQLSRFSKKRTHAYPDTKESNLLATVTPIELPPENKRLKLITSPDVRHSLCHIKTVNLLPAVLASKEAERAGADEAVFIKNGTVTECAHSNIHFIKDGALHTHPADSSILPGIAREHLFKICKRLGIPVFERKFTLSELACSDSVLVTSTSKLCLIADTLDGKPLKSDKIGAALRICSEMRRDYENECGKIIST